MQSIPRHPYRQLLPFFAFFLLLTWLVRNNSFFWDSILLSSEYSHWYYSTNFTQLFVPEAIAGYPPLFGMYIALGWKIFGRSLAVSHFLMLPFLFGIVVQVYYLVSYFTTPVYRPWLLLLLLMEPTFLAQATQVAPDVVLVFLYLAALNAILYKKPYRQAVVLIVLGMLSPRGTIAVVAVFVTELVLLFIDKSHEPKVVRATQLFQIGTKYIPAALVTGLWLLLHYQHFGWVLYNSNSAWSEGSELVGVAGFVKNLAVIAWRFLDFGRVAAIGLLLFLCWHMRAHLARWSLATFKLIAVCLVPLLVLSSVLVFFNNAIGHRYYVVVYMLLLLLVGHLLQLTSLKYTRAMYVLLVCSLLVGHFMVAVYPEKVSKGWDGTLAHLPYYHLRQNMIHYLDQEGIALQEVGSAFPNLRQFSATDLRDDTRQFAEKDLASQRYIFYSNVFNDFTDAEIDALQREWVVQQEYKAGPVFVRLYRR